MRKRIIPLCRDCGESDTAKFYKNNHSYCKSCANARQVARFQNTRRKIVEYLGGSCAICGYNKHIVSLGVHHLEPEKKSTTFKRHKGWSWERVEQELQTCVLLCHNCHAEVEAGLVSI